MKNQPFQPSTGLFDFQTICFRSLKVLPLIGFPIMLSSCLSDDLSLVSQYQQDFEGITKLEVNAGFLDIEYIGEGGASFVNLEVMLRSNSKKKYEVDHRFEGRTLIVNLKSNNRLFGNSATGEGTIKLKGPRNMLLDLDSDSGSISVDNVASASCSFETNSGSIFLKNITSPTINIRTISGFSNIEKSLGIIRSFSDSGGLSLVEHEGNLEVETENGKLYAKDLNGQLNFKANSGDIELVKTKSIGNIQFSSGQLVATNSGLSSQTKLKASSGDIFIQTFTNLKEFNFDIKMGVGSVKVGEHEENGSLKINNEAPNTIHGEVESGKIEIVN
jgi:DUF4097 and DUF4098 domain-containing protein YvlB